MQMSSTLLDHHLLRMLCNSFHEEWKPSHALGFSALFSFIKYLVSKSMLTLSYHMINVCGMNECTFKKVTSNLKISKLKSWIYKSNSKGKYRLTKYKTRKLPCPAVLPQGEMWTTIQTCFCSDLPREWETPLFFLIRDHVLTQKPRPKANTPKLLAEMNSHDKRHLLVFSLWVYVWFDN